MSVDLMLRRTMKSGPLTPSQLGKALEHTARPGAPRAAMRGHFVRFALALDLEDDACAAIGLDFAAQGARVTGSARGPSGAVLYWCFHALAAELGCELFDPREGVTASAHPDSYRGAAAAYVEAYERDALVDRARRRADAEAEEEADAPHAGSPSSPADVAAFLTWLAQEEHLALAGDPAALAASLSLDDPSALYEVLLESDAVDEVFVGETELTSLLARWKARR